MPQAISALDQKTQPDPGSMATPGLRAAPDQIIGFRGPTVILYSDELSNDGQRMPAAALQAPLPVRSAQAGSPRVQIMTVYGPRWIARAEVVLASSTPYSTVGVR